MVHNGYGGPNQSPPPPSLPPPLPSPPPPRQTPILQPYPAHLCTCRTSAFTLGPGTIPLTTPSAHDGHACPHEPLAAACNPSQHAAVARAGTVHYALVCSSLCPFSHRYPQWKSASSKHIIRRTHLTRIAQPQFQTRQVNRANRRKGSSRRERGSGDGCNDSYFFLFGGAHPGI